MKTSYIRRVTHHDVPGAILICKIVQEWMPPLPRYKTLAPSMMLPKDYDKRTEAYRAACWKRYEDSYKEQLDYVSAQLAWIELHQLSDGHEPVLCCYEADRTACHRSFVAEWFEEKLGHVVAELPDPEAVPEFPL